MNVDEVAKYLNLHIIEQVKYIIEDDMFVISFKDTDNILFLDKEDAVNGIAMKIGADNEPKIEYKCKHCGNVDVETTTESYPSSQRRYYCYKCDKAYYVNEYEELDD